MKTLVVLPKEQSDASRAMELSREQLGLTPRWSLFETAFNTRRLDLKAVSGAPWHRRVVYRFLPKMVCLAYEAYRVRGRYDVVVTWSEQVSVFFALLQILPGRRVPQLAMLYWMSKPTIAPLLWLTRSSLDRIVTWSSVQYAFAVKRLGYPEARIDLIKHFVDQLFWHPLPAASQPPEAMICSAGAEMRDFPTLIEAMRDLPIHCVIAAREIRLSKNGLRAHKLDPATLASTLPENVSVMPHTPEKLRELYARSRFVVVPLLPSDTDNGITVVLEAMAMGKAVICTRTKGQVDAIEDGVTGIFVEGGDPAALRAAIEDLLNDPEKAERIGRAARAYIERSQHPFEHFVAAVVESAKRACRR